MDLSLFSNLSKKLKKHQVEVFLLISSLIIVLISLILYLKNNQEDVYNKEIISEEKKEAPIQTKIFVELSGAVKKPDVYEIDYGSRLKDVLKLAGGLSEEADKGFVSRNYNLAKIVVDQEKIYIPFVWEINAGLFTENSRTLDYTSPVILNNQESSQISDLSSEKININLASAEELDTLPGIGKVTVAKIINNRPYSSIEELLNKKIVGKSVYEKIKELINVE
ncbi:MAG: ComEA family DNA-binding protein [Patescibacteria group bacterium]|nr:ComEA family DNA-binding protein [Patescibacteria group bacterium]